MCAVCNYSFTESLTKYFVSESLFSYGWFSRKQVLEGIIYTRLNWIIKTTAKLTPRISSSQNGVPFHLKLRNFMIIYRPNLQVSSRS